VKVPESDVRILMSTHSEKLTEDEQEVLKEYIAIMRKKVPFWDLSRRTKTGKKDVGLRSIKFYC